MLAEGDEDEEEGMVVVDEEGSVAAGEEGMVLVGEEGMDEAVHIHTSQTSMEP